MDHHHAAGLVGPRGRAAILVMLCAAVVVLAAPSGADGFAGSGSCRVAAGAKQQDVDRSDSREVPFKRTAARVTVSFENGNLSPAYWRRVKRAVAYWNRSACLGGRAVERCARGAKCVRVEAHDQGYLEAHHPDEEGWDDSDGAFEGRERRGWRVGGLILLNTTLLDRASARGATATITHELGHAWGLRHRRDDDDVMQAVTDDDTDPAPDVTDYWNLRVIYGRQTL